MTARRVAKRPAPRTVDVTISGGDFDGWSATARADFAVRHLEGLQSGSISRIVEVLDVIVTDHNFPDETGGLAASMGDVDPYAGLLAVAAQLFESIGKLPPR